MYNVYNVSWASRVVQWSKAQCTLTRSPGVWCVLQHIGLSGHCVKKQGSLVGLCFGGRVALDLRLSTFASPESVPELRR
jgi:hypothetical protein